MSTMFNALHESVTKAQKSGRIKASDVHLNDDLSNLSNALDDFTNEAQWDMDDFHTKKMVEMFHRIKKQFGFVKQVIESAQY